jgi:K+ transporter
MTIPAAGAEKATPEKQKSEGAQPEKKSRLARLALGALGVVFGDISTSPIYAIRECFHGQYGIDAHYHHAFFVVARERWHWSVAWAAPLAGIFFMVDVPFFAANISKILHGAWFPLVIGVVFFTLMLTWAKGRRILAAKLRKIMPPVYQ